MSGIIAIKLGQSYLAKFQLSGGSHPERVGYDVLGILGTISPGHLKDNCQRVNFQPRNSEQRLSDVLYAFQTLVKNPEVDHVESSDVTIDPQRGSVQHYYVIDLDRSRFDTISAFTRSVISEQVEMLKMRNVYLRQETGYEAGKYSFYSRISSINLWCQPPRTHYMRECQRLGFSVMQSSDLCSIIDPYRLIDETADTFTQMVSQSEMEELAD